MNVAVNEMINSLPDSNGLGSSTAAELEQVTRKYPYFLPARLLYIGKLKADGDVSLEQAFRDTELWLPNTPWLEQLFTEAAVAAPAIAATQPATEGISGYPVIAVATDQSPVAAPDLDVYRNELQETETIPAGQDSSVDAPTGSTGEPEPGAAETGYRDYTALEEEQEVITEGKEEDVTVEEKEEDVTVEEKEKDVAIEENVEDVAVEEKEEDVAVEENEEDVAVEEKENDVAIEEKEKVVAIEENEEDVAVKEEEDPAADENIPGTGEPAFDALTGLAGAAEDETSAQDGKKTEDRQQELQSPDESMEINTNASDEVADEIPASTEEEALPVQEPAAESTPLTGGTGEYSDEEDYPLPEEGDSTGEIRIAPFRDEPMPENAELSFEPFHTVDYFASQGILAREDDKPGDRFTEQLKSFTQWLKAMKRVPGAAAEQAGGRLEERKIEEMASHSVQTPDIFTEAMAEVWEKQGNNEKARAVYQKLSLLDPSKSAYFAAKIEQLNHK